MSNTNTIPASPIKLPSGEWGARTTGETAWRGRRAELEVRARNGRTWTARYKCVDASRARIGEAEALWERVIR